MLSVGFWFLFLLTPALILFLLKLANENINRVSVLNVTTFSIYTFSVLGLVPLFYQIDQYRVETGIDDPYVVFIVLLCSFAALIFFLVGAIFGRKTVGLAPFPLVSAQIKPLQNIHYLGLFVSFGLVIAVLMLYISKIESVALFVALKDGMNESEVARSSMGNDFPGYHWYKLILHDLGTVVTLSFFTLWLQNKSYFNLIMFLFAFSISGFVAVMATEKAPFVNLLATIFVVYYLVRKNSIVPAKSILKLGMAAVSILVVFYIYFMGASDTAGALSSLFSRAFAGSIAPAYFYLEYVPRVHDFYWFETFPNPGHLLPYEPINYSFEIMNWKFPKLKDLGIVGSAPTVFWGEAYLNFGFIGIPIVAFLMGFVVNMYAHLVSRLELNAISVSFTAWLIFHLSKLSSTGFSVFLYDFYIFGLGLMVLIMLFASKNFHIRVGKCK